MTPRKSSYDLSEIAYLKVPKSIYDEYVRLAKPKNKHWSELAREALELCIIEDYFESRKKVSE